MPETVDRKTVRSWVKELDALNERIARRFSRTEVRRRARTYLSGLLGPTEHKNSWQLAEVAEESTPYGVQHLLGRTNWDADLVRDDLREYVVEYLGDEGAILVVDEIGFLKKGTESVGVSASTRALLARERTAKWAFFLPTRLRRERRSSIASCTCQKSGPKTKSAHAELGCPMRRWVSLPNLG